MAATALMRQLVTAGSQRQRSSGFRQDHLGVTASASYRLRDRDQLTVVPLFDRRHGPDLRHADETVTASRQRRPPGGDERRLGRDRPRCSVATPGEQRPRRATACRNRAG